jgi:hypothetical protein
MMYSILRRSREALVVSLVVVKVKKNYNHTVYMYILTINHLISNYFNIAIYCNILQYINCSSRNILQLLVLRQRVQSYCNILLISPD